MVVRRRIRAVVLPLVLYAVSAGMVGFFIHEAGSGKRGLSAKRELKLEAYGLRQDLDAAATERSDWERRVALLRSDQVDQDLLEERARVVLGRVHATDVVIIGR